MLVSMRLQYDKFMNICQLSSSMLAGNICQVVVAVYVVLLLFVVNIIMFLLYTRLHSLEKNPVESVENPSQT